MKKATYKKLRRDSRIPKGNKIPRELKEKDKSKFLGYRKDLQSKLDIEINPKFIQKEKETIAQNRARRAGLKINLNSHPDSYYADCYINSEEYKSKHK
jgi:hypothetical protein